MCYSYYYLYFSLRCVAGPIQLINSTALECELPVHLNPVQPRIFGIPIRGFTSKPRGTTILSYMKKRHLDCLFAPLKLYICLSIVP